MKKIEKILKLNKTKESLEARLQTIYSKIDKLKLVNIIPYLKGKTAHYFGSDRCFNVKITSDEYYELDKLFNSGNHTSFKVNINDKLKLITYGGPDDKSEFVNVEISYIKCHDNFDWKDVRADFNEIGMDLDFDEQIQQYRKNIEDDQIRINEIQIIKKLSYQT